MEIHIYIHIYINISLCTYINTVTICNIHRLYIHVQYIYIYIQVHTKCIYAMYIHVCNETHIHVYVTCIYIYIYYIHTYVCMNMYILYVQIRTQSNIYVSIHEFYTHDMSQNWPVRVWGYSIFQDKPVLTRKARLFLFSPDSPTGSELGHGLGDDGWRMCDMTLFI